MNGMKSGDFRLVRHGKKEIDPLATFQNDYELFKFYQSFQLVGKFGDSKYLAVFSPYHGTQALFLGTWRVDGEMPALKAPAAARSMIDKFGWKLEKVSFYTLAKSDILSDLSERLVIDWGGSTVSWVQRKSNKPVVAILPPANIQEFKSYEQTMLDRTQLEKMVGNPTSNATWYNALRAVNGVYCITDTKNGKLYIGSAYGKNGIWGRWVDYVSTGHGGNKKLIQLVKNDPGAVNGFQYSILEILPGSSTADDAIEKECLWKLKLGSKEHGYNEN